MSWDEEDFANHHNAPSAWYKVESNGKVDISMEQGRSEKISLQPQGMLKLVKEWLSSGHQLPMEQRKELMELLNISNSKSFPKVDSKLNEIIERLGEEGVEFDIKKSIISTNPLTNINESMRKSQQPLHNNINKIHKK